MGSKTFRCWEQLNTSEEGADNIEAFDMEEAAETYCEKLEDLHDVGSNIEVNVSCDVDGVRKYWVVDVSVDWSPNFSAWDAEEQDGAPAISRARGGK